MSQDNSSSYYSNVVHGVGGFGLLWGWNWGWQHNHWRRGFLDDTATSAGPQATRLPDPERDRHALLLGSFLLPVKVWHAGCRCGCLLCL